MQGILTKKVEERGNKGIDSKRTKKKNEFEERAFFSILLEAAMD